MKVEQISLRQFFADLRFLIFNACQQKICLLAIIVFFVACTSDFGKKNLPIAEPPQNTYQARIKQIEYLTELIKENPRNPDLFNKRALLFLENRETKLALADALNAVKLKKNIAQYHITLSKVYRQAGAINQALEAIKRAEQLEYPTPDALVLMAELFLIKKEYPDALHFFSEALKASPYNADAYFYRGLTYAYLGDTNLSLADYQQAAILQPQNPEPINSLIAIYSAKKQYNTAIKYFEGAIGKGLSDEFLYLNGGLLYNTINKPDTAMGWLNKAYTINPTNPEVNINLGVLYLNKSEFRSAIRHLSSTLKSDSSYFKAMYLLGVAYQKLNIIDSAKICYNYIIANDSTRQYLAFKMLSKLEPKRPSDYQAPVDSTLNSIQ